MASQQHLRELVRDKTAEIEVIQHNISLILVKIHKLSQKFYKEDTKIQHKINKVQFSRPRGNPANQWPHTPMTSRVRVFYQIKERKETELRKSKDLLKQTFDHERAILFSQRLVLENAQRDIESQIRLITLQLHWFTVHYFLNVSYQLIFCAINYNDKFECFLKFLLNL